MENEAPPLNTSKSSSTYQNQAIMDSKHQQYKMASEIVENRLMNFSTDSEQQLQSKDLDNEIDFKIGIRRNFDIENYRQLVYEYYNKAEDLENKCTMLHRNLQELKESWEKTKMLKDQAFKEKENMTIKFAKGEKKMFLEKDLKEKAEKKCDELSKEIESFQRKLEIKNQEKARISSMYDNKLHELKAIKSENNTISNENCILKNELKLCQIAMKNQAELHRKAQNAIENLNGRNGNFAEVQRNEAQSVENLKVKLEKVELERNDKDQQLKNLQTSFNDLSLKLQTLQTKMIIPEEELLAVEKSSNSSEKEMTTSTANESEKTFKELNQTLSELEMKNKDLEHDIQSCRIKESTTLLFNKQLSEKHVALQSENLTLQNTIQGLSNEKNKMINKCKRLNEELIALSKQFIVEKETNHNEKIQILLEMDALKTNLAEKNEENSNLKQELFDQHEELRIMRKKFDSTLRELKKEIKLCKYSESINVSNTPSYINTTSKNSELSNPIEDVQPENTILNQQVLTERIVQLQKISVRKSEKIDFLEDRINALLFELRKKETLLQFFFLKEQTDTLITNEMSTAKVKMSKLGGVMASLYDARIADENLTLELLLEINCKLQAVLEDVLLKNIILKGNIEILGEEIETLNKRLKNGGY